MKFQDISKKLTATGLEAGEIPGFASHFESIIEENTKNSKKLSEILEVFEYEGYKYVGSGVYGIVFGKPEENYVVKICYQPKYDGYSLYAPWCAKNRNFLDKEIQPCIPIIHEYSNYEKFAVAHIERLSPLSEINKDPYELRVLVFNIIAGRAPENEEYDRFRLAYKQIFKYFANKATIDVHDENIMLRGNTWVITDPLAGIG